MTAFLRIGHWTFFRETIFHRNVLLDKFFALVLLQTLLSKNSSHRTIHRREILR
jgi:hypothetical protein